MSFFTNKHVVISLIAAPILAVITYIAIDHYVSPKPVLAKPGQAYPLVARSNCRYQSGKCTLVNGEFKIDLESLDQADSESLTLDFHSKFNIEGIRFALVDKDGKELQEGSTTSASIVLNRDHVKQANAMQLALNSAGILYYTETQIDFLAGRAE